MGWMPSARMASSSTAVTDAPVSISARPVCDGGIGCPALLSCCARAVGTAISTLMVGPTTARARGEGSLFSSRRNWLWMGTQQSVRERRDVMHRLFGHDLLD